jgi:hypothetical protein
LMLRQDMLVQQTSQLVKQLIQVFPTQEQHQAVPVVLAVLGINP